MINPWFTHRRTSGVGGPYDLPLAGLHWHVRHPWSTHHRWSTHGRTNGSLGKKNHIWKHGTCEMYLVNYYKSDFDNGNITLSYYQKFVSEIFQIILMGTSHDISDWIKHWCRVMFFEQIPSRFHWFPPITLKSVFVSLGFHVVISIGIDLRKREFLGTRYDQMGFPEIPSHIWWPEGWHHIPGYWLSIPGWTSGCGLWGWH